MTDRPPSRKYWESQWTTTSRSSRLRWQKHSMTCCSEPAALQQKNTKIRHLQIKQNKEIDYDEKRNPDLPLRL